MKKIKIIVVVGLTASGKTDLSLKIYNKISSEIISVDSQQVYKCLNIGTAKPNADILKKYTHHLVDILYPDETYNVGQFKVDADLAILKTNQAHKTPLLIGGTNLYLNALINGIIQIPEISEKTKNFTQSILNEKGLKECYKQLSEKDKLSANKLHPNDISRIMRALNVVLDTGKTISQHQEEQQKENKYEVFYLGVHWDRESIYQRINQRVLNMIDQGLIEEGESIMKLGYSSNLESLRSIGYKQLFEYLEGKISKKEMIEDIQQKSRVFAKKQLVWLKKNPAINWLQPSYSEDDWLSKIQKFLKA